MKILWPFSFSDKLLMPIPPIKISEEILSNILPPRKQSLSLIIKSLSVLQEVSELRRRGRQSELGLKRMDPKRELRVERDTPASRACRERHLPAELVKRDILATRACRERHLAAEHVESYMLCVAKYLLKIWQRCGTMPSATALRTLVKKP